MSAGKKIGCQPFRLSIWISTLLFCAGLGAEEPNLEAIFQLPLPPAGMTISPKGTYLISVSPDEKPQNRIIEVSKSGESKPFPNLAIGQGASTESLVLDAIKGMQTDKQGNVWILDNGRRSELPPKVVAWDYDHSRIHRVFNLAPPAVLSGSLLDDLALDPEQPYLYLTDPAKGVDAALIVLDTSSGLARRVLQGHPSVVPVSGLDLVIDGEKLQTLRLDGSVADPQGGVNPIALDRKGEWLYFGPMRSRHLYRVRTEHLRNVSLSPEKLAGLVEVYASKPLCDGITLDSKGNVYISDLAAKAIGMIAADDRQYRILVSDPRLLWPDGLCFGVDGRLYFFTNVAKTKPRMAGRVGQTENQETNYLFHMQTPASGRVGD